MAEWSGELSEENRAVVGVAVVGLAVVGVCDYWSPRADTDTTWTDDEDGIDCNG